MEFDGLMQVRQEIFGIMAAGIQMEFVMDSL
jgi:hypothetical protein